MHLNTSSRAEFFKIQFLDMKSNFCQRNKLQLKYFVQARFSNTGPLLGQPVHPFFNSKILNIPCGPNFGEMTMRYRDYF